MSIDGARWASRHSESLLGFWGTLEGPSMPSIYAPFYDFLAEHHAPEFSI